MDVERENTLGRGMHKSAKGSKGMGMRPSLRQSVYKRASTVSTYCHGAYIWIEGKWAIINELQIVICAMRERGKGLIWRIRNLLYRDDQ